MKTIAATKAQTNFFSLLDEVVVTHEPIQITSKRGNAILISEDDWRSIQETVYLLSILGCVNPSAKDWQRLSKNVTGSLSGGQLDTGLYQTGSKRCQETGTSRTSAKS